MKTCRTCGIEKDESEFNLRSDTGKYRNECKECGKIYSKNWYEEHKDEKKEYGKIYSKNWYEEHKDEKKEYNKEHKDEKKEYDKEYRKTSKGREVIRNSNSKRRTVYEDTDITTDWLMRLKKETKHCKLCGVEMNDIHHHPAQFNLDHIIPINIGGKHIMENVRFICYKCNQSRPNDGSDEIVDKEKLFEIFEDDAIDSPIIVR
jgi:hypothetical protein